jgi:hypothetical protein
MSIHFIGYTQAAKNPALLQKCRFPGTLQEG